MRENAHTVAVAFARWARDEWEADWLTAREIDSWYPEFCLVRGLEELPPDEFRRVLAATSGVSRERVRLGTATDPGLVRLRRRMERKLGRRLRSDDRPHVYRFAPAAETTAAPVARVPATVSKPATVPAHARKKAA